MSSLRVVLDACVLIPAALRDTLLRAYEAGLYRGHWSEQILEEARRNLVSELGVAEANARRLVETLREVFPEAVVAGFDDLIPVMRNAPDDRHVLAAAVACGAQVIVTRNVQDFPEAALAPYGIEAPTPDVFLTHLADLNPRQMLEVLQQQAADLQDPPLTVEDVLDNLATVAPTFVRRMCSLLQAG